MFKQEIKLTSIERSSLLKHNAKKETRELSSLLQRLMLEESLSLGSFSDEIISIINRLEIRDKEQYNGAMLRARWNRLSLGELHTKRMIGAERKYAS